MKRTKSKTRERTILPTILIAATLSILSGIILTAILAYFTLNNKTPSSVTGTVISIIHFTSVFFGAVYTMIGRTNNGALLPLLLSVVYMIILAGINILFIDSGIKIGFADIASVILPAGISALIMLSRGGNHRSLKFRR